MSCDTSRAIASRLSRVRMPNRRLSPPMRPRYARSTLSVLTMPGRITLTATGSPVISCAECTCAIEAEPSGEGSKARKQAARGRSRSSVMTCSMLDRGTGRARSSRFASSSQ